MEKNNSDLFYTCSLIEYLGRTTHNTRADILKHLGEHDVKQIYQYADVFHCEPIEKVADDFIQKDQIPEGTFDNLSNCKFLIPDYWDIGEVFARLIEDNYSEEEVIKGIHDVYQSWIADTILNFNSDFYYQSREYISMCYRENKILQ